MKTKLTKIITLLCIIFLIAISFTSCFSPDVNLVKDGSPNNYPDMTWGEQLDTVCSDGEWTSFYTDEDAAIVEYNGTLDSNGSSICIQFEIDEESNTFETVYMDVDGEECSVLEMSVLIEMLFEQ